ncbi:nucleotidyltransferase family protein [Maribacter stanieri]|uniref:nucleotidyltransferase family protein n=1 Tax=Maribacter stanieri TaxID=440514 RepID=UPI002495471F|nr:nucleotidyltransferase family protein [Maribacter stanieri]
MKKEPHIAVLIMAAGASKRMDGIKQLMPWKDSNFLLETIKTVQKTNLSSIHVVLGANAEIIAAQCVFQDINIITNPNWDKGLGNSIAYGVKVILKEKNTLDGILICLVDQPLLTPKYLQSIVDVFKMHPTKIIATNYGNKAGVPALFPKLLFQKLCELEGDYGAKDILNNQQHAIIQLEAGNQIRDIDTKEEYNQLLNQTKNEHTH